MPKAAQVLAALKRDGWEEARRRGSPRRLQKGDQRRTWAFHDSMDLGGVQMAKLRIEYRYDPESDNWSFVVRSLGIVGGAETRELAAKRAIEAIEFSLESENDAAAPGDGEVDYLRVTLDVS